MGNHRNAPWETIAMHHGKCLIFTDTLEPDSILMGGNSDHTSSLSLDYAIEIMPIARCIGVVFSLVGSLKLDPHHFDLLFRLKWTLTFLIF